MFVTRHLLKLALPLCIVSWLIGSYCYSGSSAMPAPSEPMFKPEIIDREGPRSAWGKSVGDINGDGLPDLIVGGHQPSEPSFLGRVLRRLGVTRDPSVKGELRWYQNPDWEKHVISDAYAIRTDLEARDMNGDGLTDVVALTDQGLTLFIAPDWSVNVIDGIPLHDVELADLDDDGDVDIVARNQTFANHSDGNVLYLYRQDGIERWHKQRSTIPHGEGLVVDDMNADGRPDIVVSHLWLENPGSLSEQKVWQGHRYTETWSWDNVFIDTADINSDGYKDIVLTPSEPVNSVYRISWFQAPQTDEQWIEHVIDAKAETVHHFVAAEDINNDGAIDVLTAEMNQGQMPNPVKVYLNAGKGRAWKKSIISDQASHSMRVVDIDEDGDIDLFGANWHLKDLTLDYPVTLWLNQLRQPAAQWRKRVIGSLEPGKALFVNTEDLNGDGFSDIIAGAYWFQNPGESDEKWVRHAVGEGANNAILIRDFDGDELPDILSSSWHGDKLNPNLQRRILNRLKIKPYDYGDKGDQFVWARNQGKGEFQLASNIESASGDYLQGVGWLAPQTVLLSWHKAGYGLQTLTVPASPKQDIWQSSLLSQHSQDEAVSVSDLDGDGDEDIILGTQWLRGDGEQWAHFTLFDTKQLPDRNQIIDMNADGRLDSVVGYQSVSRPGKLAWYEQGEVATELWREHVIAKLIGPMSFDVADLDGDGDLDVVVGEHNLRRPSVARLIKMENLDGVGLTWRQHVLSRGNEHHNGAQLFDYDLDGDLDIVSIGWGHKQVLLYENPHF